MRNLLLGVACGGLLCMLLVGVEAWAERAATTTRSGGLPACKAVSDIAVGEFSCGFGDSNLFFRGSFIPSDLFVRSRVNVFEECNSLASELEAKAHSLGCTVGQLYVVDDDGDQSIGFQLVCSGSRAKVVNAVDVLASGLVTFAP